MNISKFLAGSLLSLLAVSQIFGTFTRHKAPAASLQDKFQNISEQLFHFAGNYTFYIPDNAHHLGTMRVDVVKTTRGEHRHEFLDKEFSDQAIWGLAAIGLMFPDGNPSKERLLDTISMLAANHPPEAEQIDLVLYSVKATKFEVALSRIGFWSWKRP